MNYFEHCQSVEEAKKRYRELLMQYPPNKSTAKPCLSITSARSSARKIYCTDFSSSSARPDHAGEEGEAITKEIIQQFNNFLNGFMSRSFNSYYEDKEWKPGPDAVTPFQEIVKLLYDFLGNWSPPLLSAIPVSDRQFSYYIYQKPVVAERSSDAKQREDNKKIADQTRELRKEAAERIFNRFIKEGLSETDQKRLEQEYNRTLTPW